MNRLFCSLLLALPGWTSAGTPGGTITPPPPAQEDKGPSLEWSLGYDSDYIFRGEPLQTSTLWTQLEAELALTDSLSLTVTPWYLYDVDSEYDEFDLTSSLNLSLGSWELSLGYAGYYYPQGALGGGEGIEDEQEMTFSVSRDLGPVSASFLTAYSFTREGYYYEVSLELPYEINDTFSVVLGGTLGWDTDYFAAGTGFNHVGLMLSVPVKLSESVTLTPYVAGNLPMDHLEDYDNQLFGGVKLAVGF